MKVEKRDGVTIVSTNEKLDAVNAPKLKEIVQEIAQAGGAKLVMDMEKTRLIDSSGCGALLVSLKVLVKNHGDMKIVRPTPEALIVFQLTRLHKVFEIFENLESAVKSFS